MQQSAQNINSSPPLIHILWDASPLWGHLVLNAVIQTGLSYSIIRAKDLSYTQEHVSTVSGITTTSSLSNKKKGKPYKEKAKKHTLTGKILIVPGGSGRLKAQHLGKKGKKAIQDFVANGGVYIGFCGGAGLALTDGETGLSLCPWGRSPYKNRLQHLVSGHIISTLTKDILVPKQDEMSLPVWWPGRFYEPADTPEQSPVRVLARYHDVGHDLYVADLPLNKLPSSIFEDWQNLYGVTLRPKLLESEPAIIAGEYGKGQYILSYCHLETPSSPEANSFFAHILRISLKDTLQGYISKDEIYQTNSIQTTHNTPHTDTACIHYFTSNNNIFNSDYAPIWLYNISSLNECEHTQMRSILLELYTKLEELFTLGVDLHLLFPRTDWLYGWHTSVPGSQLNALRIALLQSLFLESSPKRELFFQQTSLSFCEKMLIFVNGAKTWLLTRKLSETMQTMDISNAKRQASSPQENIAYETISKSILTKQKKELFGAHMSGGGLCGELIEWLNELLFCTE